MQKITEITTQDFFMRNLRYLRKSMSNRMSQKSLARILNLPPYSIRNYELGRTFPNAHAAYVIAAYFHCTVEDLLTKDLERKRRDNF
ncbi:helix-turn-helix transcriptional regulator [Blautia producta]|uniref:HTH cro/C1-type domain-containing protein n=2 Tax=Lachnospiraceae TaxID=186803 RepID=A0ABZ0U5X3_9FIRM|nr:DNA-binding XRE family transcriptional regulator [Blautia coccoides]WPX72368.1 hypothetical protein BLCOC_07040 [Blautia coccoides]SUY05805.1 DNA-binding protein [Blautia coccoides]